jgi:L-ascorbate metabolism protein UlaG (beta-lactamase superfamily)
MMNHKGLQLTLLEHDAFRIVHGKVVLYTDPFQIMPQTVKADIVTVTHDHYDHMSEGDLKKVVSENTIVVASVNCKEKLQGLQAKEKLFVKPGERVERHGVVITAVPAYNVNKFRGPGQPFHPREYLGVGFIYDFAGVRVYHAGDTDNIPEMGTFRDVSIAMLPVSGTYVMTAEEAAQAAKSISPELAIPMHWGAIVGTREDAEKFSKLSSEAGLSATVLEKSPT